MFLGLPRPFLLLILIPTVVGDAAHRRLRSRRHLYEVEPLLARRAEAPSQRRAIQPFVAHQRVAQPVEVAQHLVVVDAAGHQRDQRQVLVAGLDHGAQAHEAGERARVGLGGDAVGPQAVRGTPRGQRGLAGAVADDAVEVEREEIGHPASVAANRGAASRP